jgi:hypothetical protein
VWKPYLLVCISSLEARQVLITSCCLQKPGDTWRWQQQLHIKWGYTTSLLPDECHCANVFSCSSCNWQCSRLNYVGQRDERPYSQWRWETVQDVKLEEKILLAFETNHACYTRIKSLLRRLERHRKTIAQRQLRRLFPSSKTVQRQRSSTHLVDLLRLHSRLSHSLS